MDYFMNLQSWVFLIASGTLILSQNTCGARLPQPQEQSSSLKFLSASNLTPMPSAQQAGFLKKVTSLLTPEDHRENIPSELLNLYFIAMSLGVLLMLAFIYLTARFVKDRRITARQRAKAALHTALVDKHSRPLAKRNEMIEIYNEQENPDLQRLFTEAQMERPLRTGVYRHADIQIMKPLAAKARDEGKTPACITWSAKTTTDDYMAFVTLRHGKQAAGLSYADGCRPGGGFPEGRGSVEESLCCSSFYYTSLKTAHAELHNDALGDEQNHFGFPDVRSRNGLIEIRGTNRSRRGPGEEEWRVWHPEEEFQEYATVLVSQNVLRYRVLDGDFWKLLNQEDQHYVTIVSAAAPRWAMHTGDPSGHLTNATEEESDMLFNGTEVMSGKCPLREAVESLILAPKRANPDLDVLVVGPWGTGPLRGNFEKNVHYILRVLIETNAIYLYEEVHFNFYANQRIHTLQDLLERGLQLRDALEITVRKVDEPIACYSGFVPPPAA